MCSKPSCLMFLRFRAISPKVMLWSASHSMGRQSSLFSGYNSVSNGERHERSG